MCHMSGKYMSTDVGVNASIPATYNASGTMIIDCLVGHINLRH